MNDAKLSGMYIAYMNGNGIVFGFWVFWVFLVKAGKQRDTKKCSIKTKTMTCLLCVYRISVYLVNLHWISHILRICNANRCDSVSVLD